MYTTCALRSRGCSIYRGKVHLESASNSPNNRLNILTSPRPARTTKSPFFSNSIPTFSSPLHRLTNVFHFGVGTISTRFEPSRATEADASEIRYPPDQSWHSPENMKLIERPYLQKGCKAVSSVNLVQREGSGAKEAQTFVLFPCPIGSSSDVSYRPRTPLVHPS